MKTTKNSSSGPSALASALRTSITEEQKSKAQLTSTRRSLEISKDLKESSPKLAYRAIIFSDFKNYTLKVQLANLGMDHSSSCHRCAGSFYYDTIYCTRKEAGEKEVEYHVHFRCLTNAELRRLAGVPECLSITYWTDANFSQRHATTIVDCLKSISTAKENSNSRCSSPTEIDVSLKVDLQSVSTKIKDSLLRTAVPDKVDKNKKRSSLRDSTKAGVKKSVFIEELDKTDDDDANSSTGTFIFRTVLDDDGRPFEGQAFGELTGNPPNERTRQEGLGSSDEVSGRLICASLPEQVKCCEGAGDVAVDDAAEEVEQSTKARLESILKSTSRPRTPKDKCADSETYLASVRKSTRSGSFPLYSRIGTPAAPPQNSAFEPRNSTPSHSPPWLKRFSAKTEHKIRPVSQAPSPLRRVSEKRKLLTNDELEPYSKMRKTSRVSRAPSNPSRISAGSKNNNIFAAPARNSVIYSPSKGLARMRLPGASGSEVKKPDDSTIVSLDLFEHNVTT